ncbi:25285_t:CDS:1, partial [Gigaspora margarita]
QELLKISKENIDNNEQQFLRAISDTPTRWNSSYIAWKRLLQIKRAVKLMEATMGADNDYNIRKDAIRLKSLMIIEEEWIVLEELTMILAPFAEITELLGGSNYSTLSFVWPAIITLTRNCEPLSMNISNEELDLMNMLTIFEEEEEKNIVDLDDDLEIITMADGSTFKFSQPQNTDSLAEKVKEGLYKALSHYWDAPLNCSLIAMLLDPRCKLMKKLDSWERNKATDLLREKYNLLSAGDKNITNVMNVEQNENQISLFSIMFGSDAISKSDKNE